MISKPHLWGRVLSQSHAGYAFFEAIVGPIVPVSGDANPPARLRILPLEGFQELTSS